MRVLPVVLMLGLLLGGCAMLEENNANGRESAAPVEDAATPEAAAMPAAKKAAPGKKSAGASKKEAAVRAELDKVGHKLAAQAARTVMPSRSSKQVKQRGKEYVATYVEIDSKNVTTEMRPGTGGQYVGVVRYQEKIYECRGKNRAAALKAQCEQVRSRRLSELIRYDGKRWQY